MSSPSEEESPDATTTKPPKLDEAKGKEESEAAQPDTEGHSTTPDDAAEASDSEEDEPSDGIEYEEWESDTPNDDQASPDSWPASDERELSPEEAEVLSAVVNSLRAFGCRIFQQIADEERPNFAMSPFSIAALLVSFAPALKSSTKNQLLSLLEWSYEHPLVDAFMAYTRRLKALKCRGCKLLKGSDTLLDPKSKYTFFFLDATIKHVPVKPHEGSFSSSLEGARLKINDRVKQRTDMKVKSIIPAGSIPPSTALLMVSGVHFKARWHEHCRPLSTCSGCFRPDDTRKEQCTFMKFTGKFLTGYSEALQCDMIHIPLAFPNVAMTILRPTSVNGLPQMEGKMTSEALQSELASFTEDELSLQLPCFTVESSFRLSKSLAILGLTELLSEGQARYDIALENEELHLSEVFHKVIVEVDEVDKQHPKGSLPVEKFDDVLDDECFLVRHPFVFVVWGEFELHRGILIMGRVTTTDCRA